MKTIFGDGHAPRKKWVFNPNAGGIKIPDPVKHEVEKRITSIAEKHYKGKYTRLDIRFNNERLRNTPLQ